MFCDSCVFCKIIQKEIPSKIIYENDRVIAIEDLHPKAPIHFLIMPKKHITSMAHLEKQDSKFFLSMAETVKKLAYDFGLDENPLDFNLISNNGASSGQSIFHLHWHFISGKNLYEGGFTL